MTVDLTERLARRDRGPFPSRHDNVCDHCGQPIQTGHPVVLRHLWGGRRVPLHDECAQ